MLIRFALCASLAAVLAAVPPPLARNGNLRAQATEQAALRPGAAFQDCPDCPLIVVAPAGAFMMGSPDNEPDRESWKKGTESPQHLVTIGKPFAAGQFAVTRAQFAAFADAAGYQIADGCHVYAGAAWTLDAAASWRRPAFEQGDDHPVVCVNWHDAQAYVAWLNSKTPGAEYRLLSEAEREYVTRAGTTTPFWWGRAITPDQANYDGNFTYKGGGENGAFRQKTEPVRSFAANPFGLYQVHGNVWEWMADCYNDSYLSKPSDLKSTGAPWLAGDCSRRVLRGGGWNRRPETLRAAYRTGLDAAFRGNSIGFRITRDIAHCMASTRRWWLRQQVLVAGFAVFHKPITQPFALLPE